MLQTIKPSALVNPMGLSHGLFGFMLQTISHQRLLIHGIALATFALALGIRLPIVEPSGHDCIDSVGTLLRNGFAFAVRAKIQFVDHQ